MLHPPPLPPTMCCFSGPVRAVFNTRIFARSPGPGRQFLVYQMRYEAAAPVAMVLPLPVALPTAEGAVRFLNLKGYPAFFSDLASGFPVPRSRAPADPFGAASGEGARLEVESVGDYEASYVPRAADFSRLDPRFRLPEGAWEKLPDYRDFGFAVFKLKAGAGSVHPIAFEFSSRLPAGELFFPTVHIHDGKVHEEARYDHALYLQGGPPRGQTRLKKPLSGSPDPIWQESPGIPVQFMKAGLTAGTVDPRQHVFRLPVTGKYLNRDVHVTLRTS